MIHLDFVRPEPLYTVTDPNSETWDKSVTFKKGKRYLITAPSGKGKSTLIHILYGLRNDYDGTVSIDEKQLSQISLDEWSILRQEKISIVFQNLRLFKEMTAMENILLKSNLKQYKTEAEILVMAQQLGIAEQLNNKCDKLSYGQQQRVAIIRAMCQPFDFLLLDEPFSHLDSENIKIASRMIDECCKKHSAGLILVSLGDEYLFTYDKKLQL